MFDHPKSSSLHFLNGCLGYWVCCHFLPKRERDTMFRMMKNESKHPQNSRSPDSTCSWQRQTQKQKRTWAVPFFLESRHECVTSFILPCKLHKYPPKPCIGENDISFTNNVALKLHPLLTYLCNQLNNQTTN